ncbi:MAG: tRNA-dihydrouridine synthase family protein [Clostridia bacterium]|nr:tRNA-dihydrouridine synthase family protein [Clostridia bacterium]
MKLYFAPLEGIATHTYRTAHAQFFGGCDGYFSPFITPTENEKLGGRAIRDILPENNKDLNLTVQVLANRSEAFLSFVPKIKELGYTGVNLNFGCPSGTVVKKGRGAGFLRDPDGMDRFLYEIFDKSNIDISIKTRTGFLSGEEMPALMEVYNKYPVSLLIIHPRAREDFYNGVPDMETFKKAYSTAKMPICYNGNIFSASDFCKMQESFPNLHSVMIGRGALANPAIFREIRGGSKLATNELQRFTECLEERYLKLLGSEVYTLHKLKELWLYIMWNFPQEKKILKAIKKANNLKDLMSAIAVLPKL